MSKSQTADVKVTIVTIAYNAASTIEDTIKSVLAQDYKNREYVLIDGGSTDGTLDIIDRYRDQIDRITSTLNQDVAELNSVQKELARVEKTMGDLSQRIRGLPLRDPREEKRHPPVAQRPV